MTGPWEKYATQPESGPWEKYAQQPQQPTSKPEAPGFMEGAGVGFNDPSRAVNQLLGGVSDFMLTPGAREKRTRAMSQLDTEAADYEARRAAAGDTGIDWGRMAGNVVNPVTMLPAAGVARAATPAGRIWQGAKIGAATAPLTTPASPGAEGTRFATEKAVQTGLGAAAGAIIPGAWEGSKLVGRGVRNVVDPLLPGGGQRAAGRLANDVAGESGRRQEVISALAQSRPITPGSQQTAGQAAAPAGSAEFSALQKITDEFQPTPADAVRQSQEAARLAAIRNVGQDEAALTAAKKARQAASDVNYPAAFAQPMTIDDELKAISTNPYFRVAQSTANTLARASEEKPSLAQYLHYVKEGLDEQLMGNATTTLGAEQKRAIQAVRERLIKWLGKNNVAYEKARAEHAALSKPIDQMTGGQILEKKLVPALEAGEQSRQFASAVEELPKSFVKKSGSQRYSDYSKVLTPQQRGFVDAVLADFRNNARFEELARAGMPKTRKMVGASLNPQDMPRILERMVVIANNVLNRLEGRGSRVTMQSMSELMNGDPRQMARVMESMQPWERKIWVDGAMALQAGVGGAAAGQMSKDKRVVR